MTDPDQTPPDRLDAALAALASLEPPEPSEKLLHATRGAVERAVVRCHVRTRRRWATAAIAAVLLVGLAYLLTATRPTLAFAEVADQVAKTKTIRAVMAAPVRGGKLFVTPTRTRYEDEHSVSLSDSEAGEQVILLKDPKAAYRIPLRNMGPAVNLYAVFRNPAAAASTPIADYVDKSGRHYPGLRGRTKVGGQVAWEADVSLWTDPKTKLPVRLKIAPVHDPAGDSTIVLEQFEFDVPLDDALFDMTIPAGYKLVGVPLEKLRTPTPEEVKKLVIKPGVGIGDVKFGMARDQIVEVLGEPDSTLHGMYLNYASLGLQLVLVGREPDKLGLIIANPMDFDALARNDFPGRTDQGIRIGSTREEVIAAYGQPDTPDDAGYSELELQFSFVDGKVSQITAARPN